jgi:L-amino acid N-acyltransferase YncA/transposase
VEVGGEKLSHYSRARRYHYIAPSIKHQLHLVPDNLINEDTTRHDQTARLSSRELLGTFAMPTALPDAVMAQIHNHLFVLEHDVPTISKEFNVSERAVRKWRQNWQLFGLPRPPQTGAKKGRPRIFTEEEELALLAYLKDHPDAHLDEMGKFLLDTYDKKAAISTIWDILNRHGWSRTEAVDYLTPHRTIFFWEWDKPNGTKPLRAFVQQHKDEEWCPAQAQAYRWIQQRSEALKQGRQSPTRAPGPQKPVGRPKKDMGDMLDDLTNGPRALGKADRKRLLADAGISPATYYRRLKEQRMLNPQEQPQEVPAQTEKPPETRVQPAVVAAPPIVIEQTHTVQYETPGSTDMLSNIEIRDATVSDAPAISEIYTHYVNTSTATLAEKAPSLAQTVAQIQQTRSTAVDLPYVVATVTASGPVCGYAYAAPWNDRAGYRPAAASTVYIHPDAQGRGIGRRLLEALVQRLVVGSTKTQLLAAMSVPPGQPAETLATGRLHASMGFRCVGRLERVGFKFGEILDVATYQLDLETIRIAQQQG